MSNEIELLRQMRDLLLVIAEPTLAKRDEKPRQALCEIVGRSEPKAKAVLLMDGSRSQAAIKNETGIDFGGLSRCVKALRDVGLIGKDNSQNPKLVISIPPNFFDEEKAK
jgi:hypothetical protein